MRTGTITQAGMSKDEVLTVQRNRGYQDAYLGRAYGHNNEDTSYPNPSHRDITREEARAAYDRGWKEGRN